MKTQRTLIVVLCLLVIGLGYLAFRNRPQETPNPGKPVQSPLSPAENWHTNVVEQWRTNTEIVTNVVLQPVTNEVVKEVPARLSTTDRDAAVLGYKYLHAPVLDDASDILYKVGPVAIDLYIDASSANILGENMDEMRNKIAGDLQARNVPFKDESPHHLWVSVNPRWRMSDPQVALVSCTVELKETAALQRGADMVKRPCTVWLNSTSRFVRTMNLADEVDKCVQDQVNKFCDDYLRAKEREKEIQARMPSVPAGFPSGTE